jgi:hypothetical protein
MANQKGTKWVIGVSSIALFTALVGFTSKNSNTYIAATNSVATSQTNQTSQTSAQDELTNQWMNSGQNDTNSSFNNNSNSSTSDSLSVNSSNTLSQGRSSGHMRTQAS